MLRVHQSTRILNETLRLKGHIQVRSLQRLDAGMCPIWLRDDAKVVELEVMSHPLKKKRKARTLIDSWLRMRPAEDLRCVSAPSIRVSCFLLPLHTPSALLSVGKEEHTGGKLVRNRISSHPCSARPTKYDLQNNAPCCEMRGRRECECVREIKTAAQGDELHPRSRPLHSRVLRERSRVRSYAS